MSTSEMISALSDFITNHTIEGSSHAPSLSDAFCAYIGMPQDNRDLVINWLVRNNFCSSDGKSCFRKLVAGGDIAVHPIFGTPCVRR